MNYSTLLDPLHDANLDGLEFACISFRLFDEVYQLSDDGKTLRERRGDVSRLAEGLAEAHAHDSPGARLARR